VTSDPSGPRLSVAICTRDRSESLRRTLSSLAECVHPGESWELVVVDNGSSDGTPAVVARFRDLLPIRLVSEPVAGLAWARNAAISAATGEYVLWTDDDCVVSREWLAAYADAIRRFPGAVLFGGPIVPRFEGDPPRWLRRVAGRVASAYAARDLGPDPISLSLDGNRVPFGANYAIRAREQRTRPYDAAVGRGSASFIRIGEETDVLEDLLRGGVAGRWVPAAQVTHCIPAARQRLSYLRDHYAAYGAYEEWRSRLDGRATDAALRREALWRGVRGRIGRLLDRSGGWIDDVIAASVARGRLRARRARKR
jgi:glycosyltransferase involved in cell wall biosynthesis